MRTLRLVPIALLAAFILVACSSHRSTTTTSSGTTTSGSRTTGEAIDDAAITAAVKTKLAAEKDSTLTKVNVDTRLGTVYLNGVVDSDRTKERATTIAQGVKGVTNVVNNLTIKTSG